MVTAIFASYPLPLLAIPVSALPTANPSISVGAATIESSAVGSCIGRLRKITVPLDGDVRAATSQTSVFPGDVPFTVPEIEGFSDVGDAETTRCTDTPFSHQKEVSETATVPIYGWRSIPYARSTSRLR